MARQTTVLSIFLASPSDVVQERDIVVKCVEKWNAIRGKSYGYLFELLNWERSTSASVADYGQSAVNRQIGDDYDAMIALFWHRIGSPTPHHRSGTTEEYSRAIERFKNGAPIEIGVYFKSANPPFNDIDPDQLKALRSLQESMQAEGIYHKSFPTDEGLSYEIDLFLDNLMRSHQSGRLSQADDSGAHISTTIAQQDSVCSNTPASEDDDLGYIDLIESLNDNTSKMSAFLSESAEKLTDIAAASRDGTEILEGLTALGSLEPSDMKAVVAEVTNKFNLYSDSVERGIDQFAENIEGIAQDSLNLIRVSVDFPSEESEVAEAKLSLQGLIDQMDGAVMNMNDFVETIRGLQRMTVAFNQARKRVINNTNRIIEIIQSARPILEEAVRMI